MGYGTSRILAINKLTVEPASVVSLSVFYLSA